MNGTIRVGSVFVISVTLCLLMSDVGWAADNDNKSANERPLVKTTHVYKTVGDVKVEADVYRPEGAEARPVVVWIHGGALIVGRVAGVGAALGETPVNDESSEICIDH